MEIGTDIESLLRSFLMSRSPYNRRLYGITARMLMKVKYLYRLPGKQAQAIRLEKRAWKLLSEGLSKSNSQVILSAFQL